MEHSRQPQDPCESLFRVACVSLSSVLADCRSRIRRSTDFRFATQQLPHSVMVETLHTCCTWKLKVLANHASSRLLGFNDVRKNTFPVASLLSTARSRSEFQASTTQLARKVFAPFNSYLSGLTVSKSAGS